MTQVPYTLRVLAGETETRYGERLYHSGAVHIVEKSAKRLSCKVADGEMYDVVFTDDGESRCSCPRSPLFPYTTLFRSAITFLPPEQQLPKVGRS